MGNQKDRTRENPLGSEDTTTDTFTSPQASDRAGEPGIASGFTLNAERDNWSADAAPVSFAEATDQQTYMDSQPSEEAMIGSGGALSRGSDVPDLSDTASASGNGHANGNGIKNQVKEKAGEVLNTAGEKLKTTLDSQKEKAAEGLSSLTQVVHQTGDNLRESGQARVGDYADSLATQMDRFTSYLQNTNVDEIRNEVSDYARKNPAVFLGGAFLLGIALSRFLKSTESSAAQGVGGSNYNTSSGTSSYASARTI